MRPNSSPNELEKALSLLTNCQGKVIVIGVGKIRNYFTKKSPQHSEVLALSSVALHPCDALHGDLGVITSDDVALLLSHSGETEEILTIIPHLKRRRVPLIAIVGNLNSSLARQADALLDIDDSARNLPAQFSSDHEYNCSPCLWEMRWR